MSGPFGSSQWMYSSGGFYGFPIEQSLKFNDDDSSYLSWTPASSGNRKTMTFSVWLKRSDVDTGYSTFWSAGVNSNPRTEYGFQADNLYLGLNPTGSSWSYVRTNAVFRDHSAWYHIVFAIDMTQATSTDRVKCWVNGVAQTFSSYSVPSQNTDLPFNNNVAHYIGSYLSGAQPFDGYLSEVNFIDGQALDASSFGEFKSGVWIPKDPSGLTYGTNGFRLSFADSSNIGDDTSGNTNDWTANSLVATDVLLDSPTNNFATFNPNAKSSGITLSEGNLKSDGSSSGQYGTASTFGMTSGKWYSEYVITDKPSTGNADIGIFSNASGNPANVGVDDGAKSCSMRYGANDGQIRQGNTEVVSTGLSWANGDILSIAFDMDDGKIWFAKNGVWYNSGDPAAGTNASYSSNLDDDLYFFVFSDATSGDTTGCISNFGQDSSFAGNKTAQGNTDDNGIGDFYYAPPSGYLALCTANLPDPVIDPAQDDVPSDYFNTVLYTGNGVNSANALPITGVGFRPDLVWIKSRSNAYDHVLQDAVRGTGYFLQSNFTLGDQITGGGDVSSFDTDGFTVSYANNRTNSVGATYASWSWLAGNGTSSNTDGSISSTVSVNQKAGFSIVGYTGTGSAATVGHGLGVTPKMIITKDRDNVADWGVFHTGMTGGGEDYYLVLNGTVAEINSPVAWNSTLPTSSVFSVGGGFAAAANHIAYCFAEVEGYSKFGSYTGNGSADGPFVYCGFRPAWVMVKRTDSTGSWRILDSARDGYNPENELLLAENSTAEQSYVGREHELLSNGFKIRHTSSASNASGGTYIFMAFAEQPAKYSNAR